MAYTVFPATSAVAARDLAHRAEQYARVREEEAVKAASKRGGGVDFVDLNRRWGSMQMHHSLLSWLLACGCMLGIIR